MIDALMFQRICIRLRSINYNSAFKRFRCKVIYVALILVYEVHCSSVIGAMILSIQD